MASRPRQYKPSPFVDAAEDAELYRPGGLHPIHIGDTLKDGRYKIIHKLGFGSWSTVWLARDQLKSSYIAIKIVEAAGFDPSSNELKVSRRLEQGEHMHPGRQFVMTLSDDFVTKGPNGSHQCYVTTVAGPRLTHSKTVKYKDLGDARNLASQVFQAVAYLHSCSVAHADIHMDNILLQLAKFDEWAEEDLYSCLGTPIMEKVEPVDRSILVQGAAPLYIVHPCNLQALADRLLLDRILLIDFGGSFFFDSVPASIRAPAQFTPPEQLYGVAISPSIDQWMLGCLVFEICTGYCLFKMLFEPEQDVIKDIVAMIGKPPEWMWKVWAERGRYFEDDGTPLSTAGKIKVTLYPLKARIQDMTRLYNDAKQNWKRQDRVDEGFFISELQDLYDLLRKLLVYEPESRLSFEKCLEHPFLVIDQAVA